MTKLALNKFDVAERQLLQAIRMFFREEDPVSIHTLAEAAAQILNDISPDFKAIQLFRNADYIREESKKEWFYHLSKSKNFFKHADRDKDAIHEFNDINNHFSLFDALNKHVQIKRKWMPETVAFWGWFCMEYPDLIKEDAEMPGQKLDFKKIGLTLSHNRKSLISEIIETARRYPDTLPGVTYEYGL